MQSNVMNVLEVSISPNDITKKINLLEEEIKTADTENQDPDYWKIINDKRVEINKLWAKWHEVTGR